MIRLIRRLALPIAVTSLLINLIITVASGVIWWLAIVNKWLDSVVFVANVSMLALVFAGVSGLAAAIAGILALVPTDEVVAKALGEDPPEEAAAETV